MNIALIGYGYWGKIVCKYLEKSTHFHLVKIYSPNLEKRGVFTNDISDIVTDSNIEAVFVCTPTHTHFDICRQLLVNQKHVFCEKPTVKSYDEYVSLADLAEKNNKIIYTDYIYTVSPGIIKLKKLLPTIGQIKYIDCSIRQFGHFYTFDDVYEIIGVHMLSSILYLTGDKVIQVSYQNSVINSQCECGVMHLKFSNNYSATISCSLLSPHKERTIYIYGESGTIKFDMCNSPTLKCIRYTNTSGDHQLIDESEWDFDENNTLELSILEFKKCINSIDSINYKKNKQIASQILTIFSKKPIGSFSLEGSDNEKGN